MNKTDNIYKIEFLQSLGFTPVSENFNKGLEVKCQQGHIFKRPFGNFKRGNISCPKCEEYKKKSFFNGTGFKFIKDHQIICPYGHTINRSFSAMIKSKTLTCPECSKTKNKEKIEFLQSLGFTIVSNTLTNDTLEVKCKNNHTFKRPFRDFKRGYTICLECEKKSKLEFLQSLGYTPVSENLGNELEVKCKNNHTFKRNFTDFKRGRTVCSQCEYEKTFSINQPILDKLGFDIDPKSTDFTYNFWLTCRTCKQTFNRPFSVIRKGATTCPKCNEAKAEKEITELREYIENNSTLKFISKSIFNILTLECEKGHTFERSIANIKNGALKCPKCCNRKTPTPYTLKDKERILLEHGLTPVDVSNHRKIKFKCPKGHLNVRLFSNILRNFDYCSVCETERQKAENTEMYKILEKSNLTALSDKYMVSLKCEHNHTFKLSKGSIFSNVRDLRCPVCELERYKKIVRDNIGDKFEVISKPREALRLKCKNCGGEFKRGAYKFESGQWRCPHCEPNETNFEVSVQTELENLNLTFDTKNRKIIKPFELDFYISKYNLAIECNGDYWHSTLVKSSDKNYHLNKYLLCKEKGVRLIQIPESEWYSNKEFFIDLIKCYINNGDFSRFLEGNKFNLMYLSESLFTNYELTEPELVELKYSSYYNCGYGILK